MPRKVYFQSDILDTLNGLSVSSETTFADAIAMLEDAGVNASALVAQRRGARRLFVSIGHAFGLNPIRGPDGQPLLGPCDQP